MNAKSKALGKKVVLTPLQAVRSKKKNAINMHFSEEDIRGQNEVSDKNKQWRKKHTYSKT